MEEEKNTSKAKKYIDIYVYTVKHGVEVEL